MIEELFVILAVLAGVASLFFRPAKVPDWGGLLLVVSALSWFLAWAFKGRA